jgi:hypothetical protein
VGADPGARVWSKGEGVPRSTGEDAKIPRSVHDPPPHRLAPADIGMQQDGGEPVFERAAPAGEEGSAVPREGRLWGKFGDEGALGALSIEGTGYRVEEQRT